MVKSRLFTIIFFLLYVFSMPSLAQIEGLTFKDSIYVATFTHYFIPMKISNNDTLRITNQERIASVVFTKNGKTLDVDTIQYDDGSVAFKHKFSQSGIYDIGMEIKDTTGLIHYISKTISVENAIEVPNVFSPDDDGINDIFVVKSSGSQKITLEIYTRNGDLIHQKTGSVVYWDGRLASGNYANQGIYYYILKSKMAPEVIKKGFFYLYR